MRFFLPLCSETLRLQLLIRPHRSLEAESRRSLSASSLTSISSQVSAGDISDIVLGKDEMPVIGTDGVGEALPSRVLQLESSN